LARFVRRSGMGSRGRFPVTIGPCRSTVTSGKKKSRSIVAAEKVSVMAFMVRNCPGCSVDRSEIGTGNPGPITVPKECSVMVPGCGVPGLCRRHGWTAPSFQGRGFQRQVLPGSYSTTEGNRTQRLHFFVGKQQGRPGTFGPGLKRGYCDLFTNWRAIFGWSLEPCAIDTCQRRHWAGNGQTDNRKTKQHGGRGRRNH